MLGRVASLFKVGTSRSKGRMYYVNDRSSSMQVSPGPSYLKSSTDPEFEF